MVFSSLTQLLYSLSLTLEGRDQMQEAIFNGSSWMYLELLDGYESSYGLYYIDLDDPDLKRQPKLSAHYYSHFLKSKGVSSDGFIKLEKNLTALSHDHFSQ